MLSGLLGALQEVAIPQRHLGTSQNYLTHYKEKALHLAAALLAWFLANVCRPFIQDILLALPACRALILRAFKHRFQAVIDVSRRSPSVPAKSFESLEYYVDPTAAQVLQCAALHSFSVQLQASEPLPPTQILPRVSHVLLQTEDRRGAKYLEAVAAGLASQIGATLVLVDEMLLACLLAEALGGGPESHINLVRSGGSERGGRSQRRMRFAWEALAQSIPQSISASGGGVNTLPTVVFLRSVDSLVCASLEGFEAFMDIFGPQNGETMAVAVHTSPLPPVLLLGGAIIEESGAVLTGQSRRSSLAGRHGGVSGAGEKDSSTRDPFKSILGDGPEGLGGMDDDLSLANLLLSLSKIGEEPKPDARRLLPKAFPTRVKLSAPPSGPAAARHMARLQADEADALRTDNFSRAKSVAAASGVRLPGKLSDVYTAGQRAGGGGGGALTKDDWEKVLAWAVSMESLQKHTEEAASLRAQKLAQDTGDVGGSPQDKHSEISGVLKMEENADVEERKEEIKEERKASMGQDLRRRLLVSSEGEGRGLHQRAMSAAEQSDSYWTEDLSQEGFSGEEGLKKKPVRVPSSRFQVGSSRQQPLGVLSLMYSAVNGVIHAEFIEQLVPRLFTSWINRGQTNTNTLARSEAETYLSSGGKKDKETHEETHKEAERVPKEAMKNMPFTEESSFEPMYISEAALRYGFAMLRKTGGAPRLAITPENQYEKQLLCEVLSPEALGAGFRDVGALNDAKRALREAVQLPLVRPELFQGGALSTPPKGVLLFGPPGTGKTLLARAAAAESGASFLELSLSSVASKWFGDSTRLVRAAFSLAEKLEPCVIFVDEVDALLGRRSSGAQEHEASREMKNEFMQRWDGIRCESGKGIVVLGATNRPMDLDDAIIRRFSVRVAVDLPEKSARKQILDVVLQGQNLAPDVDLDGVAERSEGFSGADLRQLCVAAAMRPVREILNEEDRTDAEDIEKEAPPLLASPIGMDGALALATQIGGGNGGLKQASPRPVSADDFEAARKEVGPSVDKDSSVVQELKEWNNKYGSLGQRSGDGRRLSYFT